MGDANLRIYYGDARIILPASDPRVAQILGLVVREVAPQPVQVEVPRSDGEFLLMCAKFFAWRRGQ